MATPKNKSEVLSQPIWNNRFLTVNKKMVFFPHWYQAGIKQISDLFYSCEGHFLPFNSFCNKFNVKCNFLQYYSILSSINRNWKKVLQEGSKDPVNIFTSYHSKPREKLNRWCSNTKSFTELYQRIACYTKWKKFPRPPVLFVLLSVRPCGICL